MAWHTYLLRAPTEADAIAAANVAGQGLRIPDDQGVDRWASYTDDRKIAICADMIFWRVRPTFGSDGTMIDPGEQEPGWHLVLHVHESAMAEADALIAAAAVHGVERVTFDPPQVAWLLEA